MSASRSYDYAASTARDAAGTIGREVAGTVGRSASNALLFARKRPRPLPRLLAPPRMLILPTATTAAMSLPFAAYLLTLSHRVIRARKSTNTLIGEHSSATGGTDPLYIAVRAHQNYLETVPTGLLLALLAELNGANRRVLAYALAGLWVLRVVNV